MIESSNKAQIFDFTEYTYSVQVVKDYPRLISMLDALIPVLEQYRHYTGAWNVLQAAYDSKTLMKVHLDYYQKIYNSKGKLKE